LAEYSGFFDGDERYGEEEFNRYFNSLWRSGVEVNDDGSMGLEVTLKDNNAVLAPGFAILRGYFYVNTSPLVLGLEQSAERYSQYARVVIRHNEPSKKARATVIYGGESYAPVLPDIRRDDVIYDLSCANILVPPLGQSVYQPTDERYKVDLCGAIRPKNSAEFDAMMRQIQQDWDSWFENQQGLGWRPVYVQQSEPTGAPVGALWIKQ